ncbi:hypothetical protein SSCG_03387 [Streptomyces clavuligerus]|nr:hypothetical protein SSCG_03387 [Streptomyces clavuligerus]
MDRGDRARRLTPRPPRPRKPWARKPPGRARAGTHPNTLPIQLT